MAGYLLPSRFGTNSKDSSPIVSEVELRYGGVAERTPRQLCYVVPGNVEFAERRARHSRQSTEAVEAEVEHLRRAGGSSNSELAQEEGGLVHTWTLDRKLL